MYKEACVLLKRAGWWDNFKGSVGRGFDKTKEAFKKGYKDFNDYADAHEWVRPAVGAGLLGLGGAGVGALTGGAKGAAIGGGAGLALGAGGGWLYDYLRKARAERAVYNQQIDNMQRFNKTPQQKALQAEQEMDDYLQRKYYGVE